MVLGPAWNGASISACRLADPVGYFTAYPLSRDHSGLSRAMGHVFKVANIGIFCPIGFFPALLWRGWRWWKSALVGLCTSVFIEFVQFFIGRSSDVDDVILNTAGTLVGFWIFWLINALLPQLTIKFQCTTKELPGYG